MSYRKIINFQSVINTELISFKEFKIRLQKLQRGEKVNQAPCHATTSPRGFLVLSINNKILSFKFGLSNAILKIKPHYTKEYGWVFLFIDNAGDIFKAYQYNPAQNTRKILWRVYGQQKALNWITAYLNGIPVTPKDCVISTMLNGNINLLINHENFQLATGTKKQKIAHIKTVYHNKYGWIAMLFDQNNNLLNAYQLLPKEKKVKLLWFIQSKKAFALNNLIALFYGLPLEPKDILVKTYNCGRIFFNVKGKAITLYTGIKRNQKIIIRPILQKNNKMFLLLIDPKTGHLLNAYTCNLKKTTASNIWYSRRGPQINWLIAYLAGLPVEPKACSIKTDKQGNFHFKFFKKYITLSTSAKNNQIIYLKPVKTIKQKWVLLLYNGREELLNVYPLIPKDFSAKPFWRTSRNIFPYNTLLAFLHGIPVKLKEFTVSTDAHGTISINLNHQYLSFVTGLNHQETIYFKPLNTKQYGWIYRLYLKDGTHLSDYQLLPSTQQKIKKLSNPYELQVLADYVAGNNISPEIDCSIQVTSSRKEIFLILKNHQYAHLSSRLNKNQYRAHLKTVYTESYGWVLRIYDENN
ncbi:MAG: hypothetical protein KKA19_01895, partial [Candidatus Margulisbacteria bacterium]|nr:hypothetical protein [Candidatus Margulisiibacteriota bacterium]